MAILPRVLVTSVHLTQSGSKIFKPTCMDPYCVRNSCLCDKYSLGMIQVGMIHDIGCDTVISGIGMQYVNVFGDLRLDIDYNVSVVPLYLETSTSTGLSGPSLDLPAQDSMRYQLAYPALHFPSRQVS